MTSTSAAFRLLSAPSGTYNKAPPGVFAAGLPAFARGALGAYSLPGAEGWRRPKGKAPPALYEFQACPFCKKAREAASLLALDLVFFPCPKGGVAFRPRAAEMAAAAGKARPQFPLLVEDGEAPLFESDAIVKTLFEKYGGGPENPSSSAPIPWQLRPGDFFGKVSLGVSAFPRAGRGRAAAFAFGDDDAGREAAAAFAAARRAMKPLVLWGYEPSPYVTLVREKLTELVSCCREGGGVGWGGVGWGGVGWELFFLLSLARACANFLLSFFFSFSFLSLSSSEFGKPEKKTSPGAPAPLQAGPSPGQEEARRALRQVAADGSGQVSGSVAFFFASLL